MHYTDRQLPLSASGVLQCGTGAGVLTCGLLQQNACPQPDLLSSTAPPASITQEYNFSPNISAVTAGRVIKRDPLAVGANASAACGATPTASASDGELWATAPLAAPLNLSGNGGMTIFTNTLAAAPANITMCVGVYVEAPPSGVATGLLDPLNLLCGTCTTKNSTLLGTVAYTNPVWPGTLTPLSFTFSYMTTATTVPAGDSIAVRVWFTSTATSGDDVVLQYDAPAVASYVDLNSQ
jgi:hypothetical protein